MEKLELKLDATMKEEGISENELPIEVRRVIPLIRGAVSKYEKNPSEVLQTAILKQDVDVCNKIYDWLDAKEEAKKIEEEAKKKEEEAKKIEEEAKKIEEEAKKKDETNSDEEKKYNFGTLDMSNAIQGKLKESGKISTNELKSIINKEPEYPEQCVFNIKLRKIYMQPFYKLN